MLLCIGKLSRWFIILFRQFAFTSDTRWREWSGDNYFFSLNVIKHVIYNFGCIFLWYIFLLRYVDSFHWLFLYIISLMQVRQVTFLSFILVKSIVFLKWYVFVVVIRRLTGYLLNLICWLQDSLYVIRSLVKAECKILLCTFWNKCLSEIPILFRVICFLFRSFIYCVWLYSSWSLLNWRLKSFWFIYCVFAVRDMSLSS
jgi:hypothetical protein